MAMPWRQKRTYTCVTCGVQLLHDQMHGHVAYRCPARPMPKERPAPVGKTYRPEAGR